MVPEDVSATYQNADGFVQRAAGFQALLAIFNGIFPLQAHLNERFAFGFFALGIKDEVTRSLILNSWRKKIKKVNIATTSPPITTSEVSE